ncbi:d-arabinose 1-dehydrogenase like protein [Danaus plexippus plexippus]|uniref:D-arabinose 1-dehydrogenase like protein n=1 Tax=Danaus plexippus plexippus TaxID=278856 RepID=A0A212EKJ6_DANPL|nr:d-arabinose 1-dehydrogenase like protein [Danaus plexippus plexippus]
MKYSQLGTTELKVSHIAVGGAAFSNIYGKYDESRGIELVKETLKRGINYLETGPWYGQGSSERTIGKALRDVPRNSFYIGSKVGRYEKETHRMFDFSAEKTEAGVSSTLERLGLEYVDLIQVHDATFAPDLSVVLKETLPTLARVVSEGRARYIGLADYDLDLMQEIVEESHVKISTISSYAKSTLFDNRLQNYIGYFKSKGVGVINAAATGMGLLCNSGPQPWHPASDDIKALCRSASEYCRSQNVELARLATWFTLNQPGIDTNICGFFNLEQLNDTVDVLEQGLTDHERRVLEELQLRYFDKVTLHWDNVELPVYKSRMEKLQTP